MTNTTDLDLTSEHDLSICGHCRMVLANGDSSGIPDYDAWAEGFDARWAGSSWRLTVLHGEAEFRTTECDGCGDELHGDRFPAVATPGDWPTD